MSFLFPSLNVTGAPGYPGPKGDAGESISAPEVIVTPTSLTVTQYQTATFYCSAEGNPKPSVLWSKTSGTGQGKKDSQGNKLQITSVGYNDAGSYVCTATNVFGQAKKFVKLFVEGKRSICLGSMLRKNVSAARSSLCKFDTQSQLSIQFLSVLRAYMQAREVLIRSFVVFVSFIRFRRSFTYFSHFHIAVHLQTADLRSLV